MKKIIKIYLLIIAFSLKNAIEFAKDILVLEMKSYEESMTESIEISPPGKTAFTFFKKGYPVKIRLIYKSSSNEKGLIWIHPSTEKIKVDIRKKYEFKHGFYLEHRPYNHPNNRAYYNITYKIDNALKDAILEIKYKSNEEKEEFYGIPYSLRIDDLDKKCISYSSDTYEIKKGKSYRITARIISNAYAGTNPPTYWHYIAAFRFRFLYQKGKEPEFGKEITFDINNNNELESTFSEDGSLFIRVDFNTSNLLDIIISSSIDNYNITIEPPGLQTVIPFKKDEFIIIFLKYKSASDEKGIIWMYPSKQEIKVDLNKTYGF